MSRNTLRNTSAAILLAIALTAVPGSLAWAQPSRGTAIADSWFALEPFGWLSAFWSSIEQFFGVGSEELSGSAEKSGGAPPAGVPVPPNTGTNNGDSGPVSDPDG